MNGEAGLPAAPRPASPLASFLLAGALSWLDWGPVIALHRGWLPFHVGPPWGGSGPALALAARRDWSNGGHALPVRHALRIG